jgi:membrane protease YdiL (CAAX protease family)
MSICLAQDSLTATRQMVLIAGGLGIAAVLSVVAGVFRSRSVLGPQRVWAGETVLPIGLSALVGVIVWIGLQILYVGSVQAQFARAHPGMAFDLEKNLTGHDYAFLSTVPFVAGFCALLVMDRVLGAWHAIGLSLRKLPAALVKGGVGFLIVFPLLLAAGAVLEWLYNAVGYQHPNSHVLLAAMKDVKDPLTRALLILGACVAAPVFEEYLFRGHIQTFLARVLEPKPTPRSVVVAEEGTVLSYAALPLEHDRSGSRVWLAILITSFFFAVVHAMWMAPLIFLLSLCLGYAYERTGNMWVSIVIHALFNTFNTIQFLYFT